jgi:hypothetical protein
VWGTAFGVGLSLGVEAVPGVGDRLRCGGPAPMWGYPQCGDYPRCRGPALVWGFFGAKAVPRAEAVPGNGLNSSVMPSPFQRFTGACSRRGYSSNHAKRDWNEGAARRNGGFPLLGLACFRSVFFPRL